MGEVFEGRCHCGAVRFEVELVSGLGSPQRCNCSYCEKLGAVTLRAHASEIKIIKGYDFLRVYTYGTHSAKHFFCAKCGVHTHRELRTNDQQIAVNAACLENLSPFDFEVVPVVDGASLSDELTTVIEPPVVGVLTFSPDFGDSSTADDFFDEKPGLAPIPKTA